MTKLQKDKVISNTKAKREETFDYLDLLTNNAPQAYPDYHEDADILHKQIENSSVYNIAVVAKYGAGKSSAINTYLTLYRNIKSHKEKKKGKASQLGRPDHNRYTRVSLATFIGTNYNETEVERSILQQLLYSRKKKDLPNSKIERTNKTSIWKSFLITFLATLFIVATTLLGIELAGIKLFNVEWFRFLYFGISVGSLLFILWYLFQYQKLKRINYKEFEVEFSDKKTTETNLINKFVDEVLYFFECVDIDLVIFEDLDRLPTTEIFAKLRELNTIINGSCKRAKKVTFLYAVKDDLFNTEEERAKYFEFILPIVPIINPVTTKEELEKRLEELRKKKSNMDLTGKFIKGISTFIPDMRILKNTFNDYIIMYHKIFDDENASKSLSTDKLFALSLYKNLFPNDYALLEKNKGLIPKVIDIVALRDKRVIKIKDEIKELNNKLNTLQDCRIASFQELKLMFYGQIAQMDKIESSGLTDALNISTFKNLNFSSIKHPIIKLNKVYYESSYQATFYTVALPKGQTEILSLRGERYIDLENAIIEREKNGIELTKKQIAELETQKQEIQAWTFAQIVTDRGVDFCFDEIKGTENNFTSQITYLRFLVAQEYIDEHYIEYTSNYKSDILSPSDTKLVQFIQSRQQNFDATIENLEMLIRWLDDNDFSHSSILNKQILLNLEKINNISQHEKDNKFINLIKLLANTQDLTVMEKIREFINTSEEEACNTLFKYLIPERSTLCTDILKADKVELEKKDLVISAVIKYATDYKQQEVDSILMNYVSENPMYLNLLVIVGDDKKVLKFIDDISPIFKKLSKEHLDEAIQQYIVLNDKYVLTLENLETIFEVETTENTDFYTKNYDFIMSSNRTSVINYISENIDKYAKRVLLNEKISCANEPQERIEQLLKNKQIEIETRKAIVEKSNIMLSNIAEFDPELFVSLLDKNLIEPTWFNILFTFEKLGFECVESFLKRTKKMDGYFFDLSDIQKETPIAFVNEFLKKLTAEDIEKISATLPAQSALNEIKTAEINDDNLGAFISAGKIQYNNKDLVLLQKKQKSICEYIKKFNQEIMDNFDAFFIDALSNGSIQKENTQPLIASIVDCKSINIEIKSKLIEKCNQKILIKGYESIYANYIIIENQSVPPNILWQFADTEINQQDKLKILEVCNYGYENDETISDPKKMQAFVESLGGKFTILFGEAKKAKIEKTPSNERLLNALTQCGLIKKYTKARLQEEYWVEAAG